jgi:hypothetical protein
VWRRSGIAAPAVQATSAATGDRYVPADARPASQPSVAEAHAVHAEAQPADAIRPVWPTRPAIASRRSVPASQPIADTSAVPTQVQVPASSARAMSARATSAPAAQVARAQAAQAQAAPVQAAQAQAAPVPAPPAQAAAAQMPAPQAPAPQAPAPQAPAPQAPPAQAPPAKVPSDQRPTGQGAPAAGQPRPLGRPVVTVRSDGSPSRPLPVVERALRNSPSDRAGWHERVVVVPGGHRPGKPDQLQRDQARARFPLAGPVRIVVLGCTAGAGQTTTTLLTGQLLATLRGEAVAVLDIGAGPGSLTELARQVPRLLPSHRDVGGAGSAGERGLQVVTADAPADQPADAGKLIDAVVARYRITIADPAAAHVPRAAHVADQLVLVAPASADAAGSLAMTMEWLEVHGHAQLARDAVAVLNGVSAATAAYVGKAASVAAGRCRAVVQVPWDDRLTEGGALGPATVHAYTALAGVLIAGLADPARALGAPAPSGRR